MKQTNDLYLPLIRKWYDMTTVGIKNEDYREITPYWCMRLLELDEETERMVWLELIEDLANPNRKHEDVYQCLSFFGARFKKFDHNIMTLGYPKKGDPERTATFKHAGIEIRTGNPDFGAEHGKLYFVIKHGEMLAEHQNTEELQHPKYFGEWILKNCTFWGNEWFMYKGYRYTGQELFEVWNSPKNVQIDKTNPTQE